MNKILSKLFRRAPERGPAIYVAGTLAGEAMTAQQIARAVQSQAGMPGFRGAVHVIEAYAAEAVSLAMNEKVIREGMAPHYLMASGYLANVLLDLRTYATGQVPDEPAKPRVQSHRRTGDE